MATPAATDLYFKQGETAPITLSKSVNGVAVDYSGYTARMQVRPSPDSPSTYLNLTTENGGISIVGGNLVLNPGAQIGSGTGAKFGSANQGVYDVEAVSPAGKVSKPFFGLATLIRAITQ